MRKHIEKHIHKKVHKHVSKHKHKHIHILLHHTHNLHHHGLHILEIAIVVGVSLISFLSANFSGNHGQEIITDNKIIAQNLMQAKDIGEPVGYNIISRRRMDSSVENTFYPGYCTYGAARISPEFFPYIDNTTQKRTRGGNAVDRCKNAANTGFKIGSSAIEGSLVVYGKVGSNPFGHVGKVMYHNINKKLMIVRDMNRVGKSIMTDRWEETTENSIKCYIYPKKNKTKTIVSKTTNPISTDIDQKDDTEKEQKNDTEEETEKEKNIEENNTEESNIEENNTEESTNTKTENKNTNQNNTTTQKETNEDNTTNTKTTTNKNNIPKETPTNETQKISTIEKIKLDFDKVSELAKHFLSQREMKAEISKHTPTEVGDSNILSIQIQNKKTKEPYEGLLKIPLEIILSNNNLNANYSVIQFIKNGKTKITLDAQKKGSTITIINFGGNKIAKIDTNIK